MTKKQTYPTRDFGDITYGDFLKINSGKKEIDIVYYAEVEDGNLKTIVNPMELHFMAQEFRFARKMEEKIKKLNDQNLFTEEEKFYLDEALRAKEQVTLKNLKEKKYTYMIPEQKLVEEMKSQTSVQNKEQTIDDFSIKGINPFTKENLPEDKKEGWNEMLLASELYKATGNKEAFEPGTALYEMFYNLEEKYDKKEFAILLVVPFL